MAGPSKATLKLNRFAEMRVKTLAGAEKAIAALGFAIQKQSQQNIVANGSVDTGSMRNSAYTETSKSPASVRGEAMQHALQHSQGLRRPSGRKAKKYTLKKPKIEFAMPSPKPATGHVKVAYAVEHAVYVECGVTGSATGDHPAKPFLMPAVEWARDQSEAICAAVVKEEMGS